MEDVSYTLFCELKSYRFSNEGVLETSKGLKVSRFHNLELALAKFCSLDIRSFKEKPVVPNHEADYIVGASLYQINDGIYDDLPLLELFSINHAKRDCPLSSGVYYLSGRRLWKLKAAVDFPLDICRSYDPESLMMQIGKFDQSDDNLHVGNDWLELNKHAKEYIIQSDTANPIFKVVKHSQSFGHAVYPGWKYHGNLTEEFYHSNWYAAVNHLSSTDLSSIDDILSCKKEIKERVSHILITYDDDVEVVKLQANRYANVTGNHPVPGIYLHLANQDVENVHLATYLRLPSSEMTCIVADYSKDFDLITPRRSWNMLMSYGKDPSFTLTLPSNKIRQSRKILPDSDARFKNNKMN